MQNVFQSDAAANSRPMSLYVEHPNDIERQFSNIAYDKAGSVIRMFMHVLTEATFVKGLNLYLNEMSFSNAAEGDLFSALNTAGREDSTIPAHIDIATTMGSWSQQAGFPIVTVQRNYVEGAAAQNVTLSQERYFTTRPTTPDNTTWWIPINYATARNPNFDDTTADEWFPQNYELGNLSIEIASLSANDWLIINKQESGYYRVLYDERNYRLLSDALYNDIDVFHNLNRAQLIDDTYNFIRTERLTYNTFLHVAKFLEFEREYASWYPAITAFTTLDRYFAGHVDYPIFRDFVRNLIEHLYETVGLRDIYQEPHITKYSRTIAINWACMMGSVHCRSDATRELRSLMSTGGDFHQNVRDVLYCASLRSGNQNDFDFVWTRLLNSNDASIRNNLLNALGCSTSGRLLTEYIRSSLNSTSDRDIVYRTGEPLRVFNAVYQNGLLGLEIAIQFLRENSQEAYTTFGSTNFGNTLTGMAQRIGNEQLIEQFNLLLTLVQEANLATATIINRSREYVQENLSWLAIHGDIVSDWLNENY